MKNNLYLKVLIKNIYFWVCLLFICFIFSRFMSDSSKNVFWITQNVSYGFIASNIFFISFSIVAYLSDFPSLEFLERSSWFKFKTIFRSYFFINALLGTIFSLLLFIWMDKDVSFMYGARSLINFLFIWLSSNTLAILIGLSFSVLLKNKLAVLFSYSFYAILLYFSFKIPLNVLTRIANIYDYAGYSVNLMAGIPFTRLFFFRQFFIVLFIICIYCLSKAMLLKRKKDILFTIISFMSLFVCLIYASLQNDFDSIISKIDNYDKSYSKLDKQDIEKYQLIINQGFSFQGDAELTLNVSENKTVSFLLDNRFNIEELSANNEDLSYKRKGEVIMLDLSSYSGKIDISIKYRGSPYYIDESIGEPYIYTSYDATNFIGSNFSWYPQFKSIKDIPLQLSSKSKNLIISHSDNTNVNDRMSLVLGEYKELKIKNKLYYVPTFYSKYQITELEKQVNNIEREKQESLKKVIVAKVYNDYVIEGETVFVHTY